MGIMLPRPHTKPGWLRRRLVWAPAHRNDITMHVRMRPQQVMENIKAAVDKHGISRTSQCLAFSFPAAAPGTPAGLKWVVRVLISLTKGLLPRPVLLLRTVGLRGVAIP